MSMFRRSIVFWGLLAACVGESIAATPLLVYTMDTDTVDITVTDNVFENVGAYGLVYKAGGLDKLPKGYRIFDNRQGRR